jgi:DNA helicase HerA-like ATPase
MTNLPTLAPKSMGEAIEFSKMISSSGMVPAAYKNKPQDILVAIQWGYEVGLQPMQALQNIAVINGKPSVYGDAAIALVKADPRCRGVKETIEGEGEKMVARCVVRRAYGDEIEETEATFSVDDAKRAKLWGKQGPWSQYPKRMLAMRARGFAIRDAFPDAMKGMITAEEAQDYPTKAPRDVTPAPEPLPEPEIEAEIQDAETIEDPIQDAIDAANEPYTLVDHEGNELAQFEMHDEAIAKLVERMKLYAKTTVDRNRQPVDPVKRGQLIMDLIRANKQIITDMGDAHKERFAAIREKIFEMLQAEVDA